MGSAATFGQAYVKAELGAGEPLPVSGTVLITVNDYDKGAVGKIARDLRRLGFEIVATAGTAQALERMGIKARVVNKASEASPTTVDLISTDRVDLVISTPLGRQAFDDSQRLRIAALRHKIPLLTTLSAATAAVSAIRSLQNHELSVFSLQEYHRGPPA